MKKLLLIFLAILFSFIQVQAGEIPNIKENMGTNGFEAVYPIRNNALVVILQPCPDNSGDFMFTVCNKNSRCYQTSMLSNEVRYIGLFLEDFGEGILSSLNKEIQQQDWQKEQDTFRTLYADYMNLYDENYGALKSLKDTKPNKKIKE